MSDDELDNPALLHREQQFESAALTPSPIEGASMDADLGLLLTAVYVTV